MKLFSGFNLGNIELKNRTVMAPLTRSRAINNIPNELMVNYYAQRAAAGLIISEGIAPSANGLGYPRIPGLYNEAQIEGWKKVTAAVHENGGKIFAQLMHTGRVSHPDNMEAGTAVVAPSAIATSGEMYTDAKGPQGYPVPKEMSIEDIEQAQNEYVQAAKNAIEAGFDGVEIHGANGYLIDQFINTASNQRIDNYGGSTDNRSRFTIEVAQKVVAAIGSERTGIRLSPYGAFNDMIAFEGIDETFEYLAGALGEIGLVYIHLVDHSAMGAPQVPGSIKSKIKAAFGGTIITSGGFDKEKAETALQEGEGELVAFGRPFLANPDLVYRMKNDIALNDPDFATFYTPGEKGYTDYPVAQETSVKS
ncbi:MAG: N-ethylmaleimide reductase [Saprospiraceae bacterium]|jgi:N-ethylmaleimide reductase